jgi:hypothetical protein
MKLLLFNAALTIAVYAYRTGFLTGIQIPDLAVVLFILRQTLHLLFMT